jgi:hypothetical protein
MIAGYNHTNNTHITNSHSLSHTHTHTHTLTHTHAHTHLGYPELNSSHDEEKCTEREHGANEHAVSEQSAEGGPVCVCVCLCLSVYSWACVCVHVLHINVYVNVITHTHNTHTHTHLFRSTKLTALCWLAPTTWWGGAI